MIQTTTEIVRVWGTSALEFLKALFDNANRIVIGEVSVNPANLAGGAEGDTVVALPAGTAAAGDLVFVQEPAALEAGLYRRRAWINATDSLTITLRNETGGAIDGADRVWTYCIVKPHKLRAVGS
jgi:hypothetical protein